MNNLNSLKIIVVAIAVFLFFSGVSYGQLTTSSATVDWEVVNGFRFIRDRGIYDELRSVYQNSEKKDALALERALQDVDEQKVRVNRDRLESCKNLASVQETEQCVARLEKSEKLSYLGWFSDLAADNYQKTCWNAETLQFRNDAGCENYTNPKFHTVRLWIDDLPSAEFSQLQWFENGNRINSPVRCDAKYQKEICIEFSIDYDNKPKEITVKDIAGNLVVSPTVVQVQDTLIVGLGDSYASGEGNPDTPAEFRDGEIDPDFIYPFGKKLRKSPRKDKDSKVNWLDKRCHRSMYSYQFKTALQLALTEPKKAVTYVSYACSGAVSAEVMSKNQKPKERMEKNDVLKVQDQYKTIRPQLEVLREVLKKRPIDYLLFSIGGNDIGFAPYVAYILTSGTALSIAGKKPSVKTIDDLYKLRDTYRTLHKTILNPESGVEIEGCESDQPCQKILLTPYPDVFNDQNGDICRANRDEFTAFGPGSGRAEKILRLKHIVFNPMREIQKTASLIPLNETEVQDGADKKATLGWSIVESHLDDYLTHGFCSQSKGEEEAGDFILPKKENGEWRPFRPSEYRAYKSRSRWIRLPVDAKLTTDQVFNWWKFKNLDLGLIDDHSNIMHPTAEGHAATAQANFQKIQELEISENAKSLKK